MAQKIQVRRGTEAQRLGIIPDTGEPLYTTDKKQLWIGDGSTAGGVLVGPSQSIEGIVTLTAGVDHLQVSGLSLPWTPTKGRAVVMKSASGGANLGEATPDYSSFSMDGGTFHFPVPIPADAFTYKLFWKLKS